MADVKKSGKSFKVVHETSGQTLSSGHKTRSAANKSAKKIEARNTGSTSRSRKNEKHGG